MRVKRLVYDFTAVATTTVTDDVPRLCAGIITEAPSNEMDLRLLFVRSRNKFHVKHKSFMCVPMMEAAPLSAFGLVVLA